MSAVALDTHTALWWSFLPDKLGRGARQAIEEASELLLPSIIFWEAALLVRKRRVELPIPITEWLRGLESSTRVQVIALTAEIAVASTELAMHEDPADRFIVATALRCNVPLVSRDQAIQAAKLVPVIW